MIRRIAMYKVEKNLLEDAKIAVKEFVDQIKENEPATIQYDAYQEDGGLSFIHFMAFKDEEAEEFHRNTPHVKKFVQKLNRLCERNPVFTDLFLIKSKNNY